MPTPPPCQWRDDAACQFASDPREVVAIDGRNLCILHWPPTHHDADSRVRASQAIQKWLRRNVTHFDGVTFPAAGYSFTDGEKFSLRHCIFEDGCDINFRSGSAVLHIALSESIAHGTLKIFSRRVEKFDFSKCQFNGKVSISNKAEHVPLKSITFEGATFSDTLSLEYDNKPSRLSINGCRFSRCPDFSRLESLPDRTFARARFLASAIDAEDEGRFRKIRNLFHANRARDEEGIFYALEKRCQRKAYGWGSLRNIVSRTFSKLYDVFSEYGQSYERAFVCFVSLQVIAALSYGVAANGLCVSACRIDAGIIRFTLAQVVKPFEAYASRGIGGWTTAVIGDSLTGAWLLATTIHSVLSLVLLALFLLALRWRFRRD